MTEKQPSKEQLESLIKTLNKYANGVVGELIARISGEPIMCDTTVLHFQRDSQLDIGFAIIQCTVFSSNTGEKLEFILVAVVASMDTGKLEVAINLPTPLVESLLEVQNGTKSSEDDTSEQPQDVSGEVGDKMSSTNGITGGHGTGPLYTHNPFRRHTSNGN
jgi:hypothetical protein